VQRFRLAAAAILSVGLLVPLAAFGATGLAQSSSAAQYQYKITICHHTHSKKHPTVTIRVSVRAWPAHQKHGDTLGPCTASKKHAKSHGHQNKSKGHSESKSHSQNNNSQNNNSQNNNQSNGQTNGKAQGKGHGK
jgi:hypothetical protein